MDDDVVLSCVLKVSACFIFLLCCLVWAVRLLDSRFTIHVVTL